MKRLLFTFLACVALSVALSANAMARHESRRHSAQHRSHSARSHRARTRHFGAADQGSSATSAGEQGDDNGTGDDQGDGSGQTAGTVTGFSGGMLTITLNDHSTVTGQVTSDTNIECTSSSTSQVQTDDQAGGGGDNGGSGSGDDGGSADTGGDNGNACTPATGMAVRGAELRISSAGAIWKDLELIS